MKDEIKDEEKANKLIKKAKCAFSDRNIQKAEEYLLRAESLYPTPRAKKYLECVRGARTRNSAIENRPSTSADALTRATKRPASESRKVLPPENGPKPNRSHVGTPIRETLEQPEESPAAYTEVQLNAVRRILDSKDMYEVLGVSKDATTEDIVKAYKRLALVVHTDKNRAPGANEAFQRVGNAVFILRDEVKRREYDLREEYAAAQDYTRGFDPNVSAEEVFGMFFGVLGLAAAGGYAGYKLGSIFSRRPQTQEVERSEPREPSAAEMIGGVVGAAIAGLAGMELLKAINK